MLQQREWIYVFIAILSASALVNGYTLAYPPWPSNGEFVYIVYMNGDPPERVNPRDYYENLLTPAVGSAKAAQEALIYTYPVIAGFSAKLTPQQASLLRDEPGVEYLYIQHTYDPEDYIDG